MKYTREDYLDNKCAHNECYGQFVTSGIESRVTRFMSDYPEVKDTSEIPLDKWDTLAKMPVPFEVGDLMRAANDYPTLAGMVCLYKEAARREFHLSS